MPFILAMQKAPIGRLWSRLAGKKSNSTSKKKKTKRAGGMTQAIEHLPSKGAALSSILVPPKTNNKIYKVFLSHIFKCVSDLQF
jgi:hypothetical protein